jgi:hypothetical protein
MMGNTNDLERKLNVISDRFAVQDAVNERFLGGGQHLRCCGPVY